MIKVTVGLTFLLLVLYKMFFVHNKTLVNNKSVENFAKKFYVPIVIVLFGVTFATSFFKLGVVPYGINVDEAGAAYDAWCIANYGVDRFMNSFPIYLTNYGGGQSALYAYMIAFLVKIFGFNMFVVRLPLAITRMVMTYCIYAIVKKEKNKVKDILILFLMATVPYFIMQSRWGLDCNLLVGFVTISVYFLIKAIEKKSYIWFALTGLFFGITAYTYALSWMFMPLFLAGTCCYLLWTKKITFPQIFTMGIVAFVLVIPLVLFLLVNNEIIEPIHGFFTVPKLPWYRGTEIRFSNIYESAYILKTIVSHDWLEFNILPEFGTIYYMNIVFCVVGLINSIQKMYKALENKKYSIDTIICIWFLSAIACQLVTSGPNINKANAVFLPVVYFTAMGIYELTKKVKLVLIPLFVLLLINFSMFSSFYYFEYNHHGNNEYVFPTHYLSALEYSNDLGKTNIYIEDSFVTQAYIYSSLLNFVEPEKFDKEVVEFEYNGELRLHNFVEEPIFDPDGVYILNNESEFIEELEAEGFENKVFGNVEVYF